MKNSVARFDTASADDRPEPGHLWFWQTPEEWIEDEPQQTPTHRRRIGNVNGLALFGEEAGELIVNDLAEQLPTDEQRSSAETLDNAERRLPVERCVLSDDRVEPAGSHAVSLAFWITYQTLEKDILAEVSTHDREDIRQEFAFRVWQKAYSDELNQTRTWRKELRQSVRRLIRLRGRVAKHDQTAAGTADEAAALRAHSIESKIMQTERNHLATVEALQQKDKPRKPLFEFVN